MKIRFLILFVIMLFMCNCETCDMCMKDFKSETKGLERTVEVYSFTGDLIKTYQGKFMIEMNENKVKFDVNGKRVIIYNALVITEEE